MKSNVMTPNGGETIYGKPNKSGEPNSNDMPIPVRLINNHICLPFILLCFRNYCRMINQLFVLQIIAVITFTK